MSTPHAIRPAPAHAVLLLLTVPLSACGGPSEAVPPTLDEYVRGAWSAGTQENTSELASLSSAFLGSLTDLAVPLDGDVTDLETADLAPLSMGWDAFPGDARGFLHVDGVACSGDAVAELLTTREQGKVYPDAYDTYSRTSDEDASDFLAHDLDVAHWTASYAVESPFGGSYSADVIGAALRFEVEAADAYALVVYQPVGPHPRPGHPRVPRARPAGRRGSRRPCRSCSRRRRR